MPLLVTLILFSPVFSAVTDLRWHYSRARSGRDEAESSGPGGVGGRGGGHSPSDWEPRLLTRSRKASPGWRRSSARRLPCKSAAQSPPPPTMQTRFCRPGRPRCPTVARTEPKTVVCSKRLARRRRRARAQQQTPMMVES